MDCKILFCISWLFAASLGTAFQCVYLAPNVLPRCKQLIYRKIRLQVSIVRNVHNEGHPVAIWGLSILRASVAAWIACFQVDLPILTELSCYMLVQSFYGSLKVAEPFQQNCRRYDSSSEVQHTDSTHDTDQTRQSL